MKTLSAREAKYNFGMLIDSARAAPVVVEKHGRPVVVVLSVEEYERLKEFSENIVESINVGILAADLVDRVESWNTQIERLTGIAREAAVGRRQERITADRT